MNTLVRRALIVGTAVTAVALTAGSPAWAGETVKQSGSMGWGAFTCTLTPYSGHLSGLCDVSDKKADGTGVYLQYKGYRNGHLDTHWGRLTDDVGPAGTTERFTIYDGFSGPAVDYYGVRVCRHLDGSADPCGAERTWFVN
jgi:hypothetical protein